MRTFAKRLPTSTGLMKDATCRAPFSNPAPPVTLLPRTNSPGARVMEGSHLAGVFKYTKGQLRTRVQKPY